MRSAELNQGQLKMGLSLDNPEFYSLGFKGLESLSLPYTASWLVLKGGVTDPPKEAASQAGRRAAGGGWPASFSGAFHFSIYLVSSGILFEQAVLSFRR